MTLEHFSFSESGYTWTLEFIYRHPALYVFSFLTFEKETVPSYPLFLNSLHSYDKFMGKGHTEGYQNISATGYFSTAHLRETDMLGRGNTDFLFWVPVINMSDNVSVAMISRFLAPSK